MFLACVLVVCCSCVWVCRVVVVYSYCVSLLSVVVFLVVGVACGWCLR